MTDQAIARPLWPTRTTLWTSVALCVQILGSLWIMAGALYVVPLLLLVPLVPIAFTVFAYVGQRHKRPVGPTVFLALACACEAAIAFASRGDYWESAVDVLAVPTPPGTLEPFYLLEFSYWVWHCSLPAVVLALVAQLVGDSRVRERNASL